MDSQRRIRTSLRLELESTSKELQALEEQLEKGETDPEVVKRAEELREYKKKLETQYEEVAGITSEKAAKLELEEPEKVSSATVKILLSLLTSALMAAGAYNIALHGVDGFAPTDLLDQIMGSSLTSEISIIQSMAFEDSSIILIGIFGGAMLLYLISLLFKPRGRMLQFKTLFDIITAYWLSYGLFFIYFELPGIGDDIYAIQWSFREAYYVFGGILILNGLFTLLSSFGQIKGAFNFFAFLEALLILGAGGYYLGLMAIDATLLEVWPLTFTLLLFAYVMATLKSLFYSNKKPKATKK